MQVKLAFTNIGYSTYVANSPGRPGPRGESCQGAHLHAKNDIYMYVSKNNNNKFIFRYLVF